MTVASTWLDLVLGIDVHYELVPTPAPVPTPFPHPFVGMVLDPAGLAAAVAIANLVDLAREGTLSAPKGPVLVNSLPATHVGTMAKNSLILPHFVIPPGTAWAPMPKAPKPKIGAGAPPPPDSPAAPAGDAIVITGSRTVFVLGTNAARLGDLALSCSEPIRLPCSIVLAIPKGSPVVIGGAPAINYFAAAGGLLRSKWVSSELHGLVSRLRADRLRNFFHKAVCFLTGHPVDVASGRVLADATDFRLPGPIPLVFERNYASSWAHRDSPLGYGWSHSLDQAVWIEPGKVVYRTPDGREVELDTMHLPDHAMRAGDVVTDPFDRLRLRALGEHRWRIETHDGLTHHFGAIAGDSRPGRARIVETTQRDGHAIRYEYDARARLEWVTDGAGRRILFEHDAHDRLVRIALPHPTQQGWLTHCRFAYSPSGDLVEARDALGHARRFEYQRHLLVRETDRTGLSFHFGYDGLGSDARCIRTWGDEGIHDHEIVYDVQNHVTVVTDSLGKTTVYKANAAGAIVEVTDPHGAATRYAYDGRLRRTREVDPLGHERTWSYDERGNCTRTTGFDGAATELSWDAHDQPVLVRDPCGGEWLFRYDSTGRPVERVDPTGASVRLSYAGGYLASVERADGMRLDIARDEQGNATRFSTASEHGPWKTKRYDRLGRVVSVADSAGNETERFYDAAGRLVRLIDPDGMTREVALDEEGYVVAVVDRHGRARLEYTGFHRLCARDVEGARTRHRYDTEGRLVEVHNAAGEVTTLARDACGRVVEEIGFDGRTNKYEYDLAGRVVKATKPGGATAELGHDGVGRTLSVRWSDGAQESFAYREDGLMVEARNAAATVRFDRDALGRVLCEWQDDEFVLRSYDLIGQCVGVETSLGVREAFVRAPSGAVKEVHVQAPSTPAWRVGFARDAMGFETARELPGRVRVSWERDGRGRPIERTTSAIVTVPATRSVPDASAFVKREEIVDVFRWEWETSERLDATVDLEGVRTRYAYDERGRLSAAHAIGGVEHVSPDAAGNVYRSAERTDRIYAAGGELCEAEGLSFVHDPDGRVVSKSTADGLLWRYSYDAAGMLREVVGPDGRAVTFVYDALGRRLEKRVGGRCVRWLWDGNVPVHERCGEQSVTTWVFEPGTFVPLGKIENEKQYGVVPDQAGAPQALWDETGELAWAAQLDLYGLPRMQIDSRTECPWRWAGQYADRETGLHYNRFRYYDPDAGQYLTPDPLGRVGGEHAYAYTQNPLTITDPLGLAGGCGSVDEAIAEAQSGSVAAGRDRAVFWSSWKVNGKAARDFAESRNMSTLERTEGSSSSLDPVKQQHPAHVPGEAWRRVSARSSQGADGEVQAFVDQSDPERTSRAVELPTIRDNPGISTLVFRDPGGAEVGRAVRDGTAWRTSGDPPAWASAFLTSP